MQIVWSTPMEYWFPPMSMTDKSAAPTTGSCFVLVRHQFVPSSEGLSRNLGRLLRVQSRHEAHHGYAPDHTGKGSPKRLFFHFYKRILVVLLRRFGYYLGFIFVFSHFDSCY